MTHEVPRSCLAAASTPALDDWRAPRLPRGRPTAANGRYKTFVSKTGGAPKRSLPFHAKLLERA